MAELMNEITCTLLIIGAGPGGYSCAIRAGQLGIDTVIVEERRLGGTCLNVGCIPSKAIIHAAEEFEKAVLYSRQSSPLGITVASPKLDLARTMEWKDRIVGRLNNGVAGLLKRSHVKSILGKARFLDGKTVQLATETGPQIVRARNIVIATGSAPVELAELPFGTDVLSSTGALALERMPESLAVIGAGYIGLELGTAYARMGARVTIVEAADRILPHYDAELTRPVADRLNELGVELLTGATLRGPSLAGNGVKVEVNGEERRLEVEKTLVTVGRRPVTDGFGMEEVDLDMDGRFIRIDDQCRTSMRGIFAIGDVTGEPMLAHRAMAQGTMVAEIISGKRRAWDNRIVPAICFTDPEVVSAGLTPDQARQGGREVKTARFPFRANGRAMTRMAEEGFIRIVARADNHLVLGIQAVGQGVSELSAAFGLAIEMGARLEDIAATIHAHPTQGEALQESALAALGMPLHS